MVIYQFHFRDAPWSQFAAPSISLLVGACGKSDCSYESSTLVVGARRRANVFADATVGQKRCILVGECLILRGGRITGEGAVAALLLKLQERLLGTFKHHEMESACPT